MDAIVDDWRHRSEPDYVAIGTIVDLCKRCGLAITSHECDGLVVQLLADGRVPTIIVASLEHDQHGCGPDDNDGDAASHAEHVCSGDDTDRDAPSQRHSEPPVLEEEHVECGEALEAAAVDEDVLVMSRKVLAVVVPARVLQR